MEKDEEEFQEVQEKFNEIVRKAIIQSVEVHKAHVVATRRLFYITIALLILITNLYIGVLGMHYGESILKIAVDVWNRISQPRQDIIIGALLGGFFLVAGQLIVWRIRKYFNNK